MQKFRTHYDNLKVARDAPDFVIRAAYKSLSQKFHPDKNVGDTRADKVMQIINLSYSVLIDPARRRAHDEWIAQQEAAHSGPNPASTPPATPTDSDSGARGERVHSPPSRPLAEPGSERVIRIVFLVAIGLALSSVVIRHVSTNRADLSARSQQSSAAEVAPPPNSLPALNSTPEPVWAYVTTERANLRSGPGSTFPVITQVDSMSRVQVMESEGGWSLVFTAKDDVGYISSRLISIGSAEDAKAVVCDVENSARPANGEVLLGPRGGRHELVIRAPSQDVLIKLRKDGQTVLAAYVRANESATFAAPEGTFKFMFASGEKFSRKCMEFLSDMTVSADPNPVELITTYASDSYAEYSHGVRAEYTLTTVRNGNFRPVNVDQSDFSDFKQ